MSDGEARFAAGFDGGFGSALGGWFQKAPIAVLAVGRDGGIVLANRQTQELFGYASAELIGQSVEMLVPERFRHGHADLRADFAGHRRTRPWEVMQLCGRRRDGTEFPADIALWSVATDHGELATVAVRDVSQRVAEQAERERLLALAERERASARLERSQRLESLGQLAGGIAHDFNNLLAIITGYAEDALKQLGLIQGQVRDDQLRRLTNEVDQIARAGHRAATLTHQLLNFARRDTVAPDVIDVNATITEMLELLRRTLGPHIELVASLHPAAVQAQIDPGQLGQILINLAVNGREAMPDGGRLAIQTTRAQFVTDQALCHGLLPAGAYVRVRVTDDGVGMPPEVVAHALEPFFTTRAVGEGTGLGLATVYGIVTQAGGQVEISSEPGHGTTVAILLPATDAPVIANQTRPAPHPPPPTTAHTILIVDDEPALQDITARILTTAGYAVIKAKDGAEAITLAQSSDQPIHALLTDVVMPGLSGQDLAQRLAATRPSLRIIFMSGFARPLLPDAGRSLPGGFLQKPFTETELLATIADTLAQPGQA